jgi:glycogen debranching enzyme
MPVVLGQDLPEDVLQAVVSGLAAHRTDWGVATERVDSAKYTDDGYWRGPVWAPSTMLVVEGLRACGADDLADDIAEGFCQACATNGFAENFDARTGAGLRDRTYTWTASAFRCLAL